MVFEYDFDYDKEEKKFIKELNEGKFKTGSLPNAGTDYDDKKGARDLEAFDDYLNSESFKILNAEATK